MAATHALQSLVESDYDLKLVYPINQLGIWGIPSCEQVYNSMLRNGWIRSMNFIVRNLAPSIFRSYMRKLERIINSYIKTYKPALVVSVIPFVNLPASEAARKSEIPFLVITTDNDLRNWAFEMEKIQHPHVKVTIGADLPTTRDILLKKKIPDEAIATIGLPLRLDFMAPKDRNKILQELNLPPDRKIILIMMGGAGGNIAYKYAKRIGNLELASHLVVIAGRNNKLKEQLEQLEFDSSNTLSVFGYTDRVSDIMAVSDVLITKPGPGTINEAIAMKLPILIDDTDITLFWERANVDYVVNYKVGQKIRKFNQVENLIWTYLKDEKVIENTKKSFVNVPPNQFHVRVQGIIKEMMSIQRGWLANSNVALADPYEGFDDADDEYDLDSTW